MVVKISERGISSIISVYVDASLTLMEENILVNLSVEKDVLKELVFLPGKKQFLTP